MSVLDFDAGRRRRSTANAVLDEELALREAWVEIERRLEAGAPTREVKLLVWLDDEARRRRIKECDERAE